MLRQRRPALAAEAEAAEDACGGGSRAAWMDKLDDCVPHPSVAGDGRHGWWWWTRRQSGAHLLLCESNGVDGFEAHIDSHGRRGTHLLLACGAARSGARLGHDERTPRHDSDKRTRRRGEKKRLASPARSGGGSGGGSGGAARTWTRRANEARHGKARLCMAASARCVPRRE
jgi:hypothetical protein